jgi:hypothetical protein
MSAQMSGEGGGFVLKVLASSLGKQGKQALHLFYLISLTPRSQCLHSIFFMLFFSPCVQ